MRKNRSKLNNSPEDSRRSNSIVWRVLIVAVCLVAVGTTIIRLTGKSSQAAAPAQEGKTSTDGLWQEVAESSIQTTGQREIVPQAYQTVRLQKETLCAIFLTSTTGIYYCYQ